MHIDGKHDSARDREWVFATGDGGYALGKVSGVATRRYHGQLVVAFPPPIGRVMVWPRTEEIVEFDGHGDAPRRIALRQGWYADEVLAPDDFVAPAGFKLDHGAPTWTFEFLGRIIERRLSVG